MIVQCSGVTVDVPFHFTRYIDYNSNPNLFVGNLPFSVDQNTIGNHFDNGGCAVLDVIINMDQDNRPRGFAHVEFKDRESLILAMSASGSSIGGREIKVDFNVGKSKNDRGGRMGGGDRGSDRDRGDRGGGREETELSWNRAPKRDAAPLSTKDSKNERNDREDRRGMSFVLLSECCPNPNLLLF
jgi:RNA recognition motif-containing protein